ncbi:ACP S-malonyltransferase [Bacillus sp. DJP31]|uniref:ACP S-malonyltransferase n=1 Tax=Bacillus sp. DJP31 TaxID=3409789 RepID=UPI003BB5ADAC
MSKIAFIFPGQGSQSVGMGKQLADLYPEVQTIFTIADEKLGISLSSIIFEGPTEKLILTVNTQPALLTTSMAIYEKFKQSGIVPDFVAGHSLGEYTALVAAGSISFEDAVYAVRKRGEFMEEAVPAGLGAMAAVLGLEMEMLEQVTTSVTNEGHSVQLANLNCPGQIVISGTAKGVEMASVRAKENGARLVIPLEVSGPFHSSLMMPAAERLKEVLNGIEILEAKVPVIANVTALPMNGSDEIKEKLIQQLYSPVRWQQSVEKLIELGVGTFIEIGPGKVLSGLVKKVDRSIKTYAVSDEESLRKAIDAVKGEM